MPDTAEHIRLRQSEERQANWKRWGPYLSERQWGTVREDYSPYGNCWEYFPHDQARSRAYRWGEDGLLGLCDRECRLCFALALWNGQDTILKERLFGLSGPEGNHGEDVKECYFYLDSSPTHSYLKGLYKYPQTAYPYDRLLHENVGRGFAKSEFEIYDTDAFQGNRYFDVFVEYAKEGPDDILVRITAVNRGAEPAELHLLPTVWFRNTWSWGCTHEGCHLKPYIAHQDGLRLALDHESLGRFYCDAEPLAGQNPEILLTENETNREIFGPCQEHGCVKDAFHHYVIRKDLDAVNPLKVGTKAAYYYRPTIPAGGEVTLRLRLYSGDAVPAENFGPGFQNTFQQRIAETDEFYEAIRPARMRPEEAPVWRQANAGLLWSKQFYHYVVEDWLKGDPEQPTPPEVRLRGRNRDWQHLFSRDVISMPDKWEYPWFAAWDTAFHMIPFAHIDPDFTKNQLVLFLREWYMHPNGQMPAYEFAFGDVNPPVHAWACWRVYKMSGPRGQRDRVFLERTFQKLLMNFTWWVNRKDIDGKHLFAGGFLGLDNIGVFDRSRPLPGGHRLEQADGTAWMAFYCGTMLSMALELAVDNPAYGDMASKFFEHYVAIADAMNCLGKRGLWDEEEGFYFDVLHMNNREIPIKIRSLVGLIPLVAVEVLEEQQIRQLPGFRKRMNWFLQHRQDLARHISYLDRDDGNGTANGHRLLAIPSRERLERVLKALLDEEEFLSPYGIRSLSRRHRDKPFVFQEHGETLCVDYEPGESRTWLFGGNSNWRGPVWFPINFLLIEALQRYHHFYGDDLQVECPTGSGNKMNLKQVARELSRRLVRLFLPDPAGRRPTHGEVSRFADDPHWQDYILFYEYFHGDDGRGLGASHQTGWTALVAQLIYDLADSRD